MILNLDTKLTQMPSCDLISLQKIFRKLLKKKELEKVSNKQFDTLECQCQFKDWTVRKFFANLKKFLVYRKNTGQQHVNIFDAWGQWLVTEILDKEEIEKKELWRKEVEKKQLKRSERLDIEKLSPSKRKDLWKLCAYRNWTEEKFQNILERFLFYRMYSYQKSGKSLQKTDLYINWVRWVRNETGQKGTYVKHPFYRVYSVV